MNQPTIDTFFKMVESLKKHQRAELLNDQEETIIEELYTDPLEGDFILKSMLSPQTTLLIGRKGTGKSTIIGRFQHQIRKTDNQLSLYLDVRTIYEQSIGSLPNIIYEQSILSEKETQKYQLYKHFLNNVLSEIQREINKNVFTNRLIKIITSKGITKTEFEQEIKKLFEDISTPSYEDFNAIKRLKLSEGKLQKKSINNQRNFGVEISPKMTINKNGAEIEAGKLNIDVSNGLCNDVEELTTQEYSTILIRYFNIINFINKVKTLLFKIGIKKVFICLDDASELDESALDIFMRTLVTPLNNSADEYFRFKISFYPGRDRLPGIDRTKVETINLDYYNLYQSTGVDKVEENAIAYTKRLLEKRFKYFFGKNVNLDDFFDIKHISLDDYYKIIFQASANVPRIIGKILWHSAKRSITQGQKINKKVLQEASKEHYIQEIEPVLYKNEYIQYTNFNEKFEREHLKKLLELIIKKAKANKRQIGESDSDIFKNYNTNTAPSNYLYYPPNLEEFLATLELNFFISKYAQQKDKGSGSGKTYIPPKEISVFTLNYGLCQKENIIFDEKSDRKFRTERVFDFTDIIIEWANTSQIIKCTNCGFVHPMDKLEAIKQFEMLCDKCFQKTCKLETVVIDIPNNDSMKIKEKDFQVLNVLKIETGLTSSQIGEELDWSYRSVNQRVRIDRFLMQNKLIIKKKENELNKYYITDIAKSSFFK